jgi:hypothetical protein
MLPAASADAEGGEGRVGRQPPERPVGADLAADAEALIHRCEQLLRALPRLGEPSVVRQLRATLGGSDDFCVEEAGPGTGPWVVYLHALVDPQRLQEDVQAPLAEALHRGQGVVAGLWPGAAHALTATQAARALLRGMVAVVSGPRVQDCVLIDVSHHPGRAVGEPTTEKVVVGPKVGFVEKLETNLALVRGLFPDPSLRLETLLVGRRSRSRVAIAYLQDVVRPGLVPLVRAGLRRIRTDMLRDSWQVAEYLTAGSLTPFPLAESTERPDKVEEALSDGRVAIFVEHTPFALLLPTSIFEFQADSESALPGPVVTTFIRTLRYMGTFLALIAPGLTVALLSANPGPLRPELAATLAVTRAGLPYPVFTEMLLMMLVVDIFNEATAQSPGGVGTALSIVGTLIIGQISVSARLVSELVMIVAAATSLGSFLTLRYQFSYAVRIWKYPILVLSGVTGLFGWVAGVLFLLVHLASLKSAGVPYLAPLAPLAPRALTYHVATRPIRPRDTSRPSHWQPQDPSSGDMGGSRDPGSGQAPS